MAKFMLIAFVIFCVCFTLFMFWKRYKNSKIRKEQKTSYRAAEERVRTSQSADPFRQDVSTSGDPAGLRMGSIIELAAGDFTVRGVVRYTETEDYVWYEYFIETAKGRRRWFSVEQTPDYVMHLWDEVSGSSLKPGPRNIEYNGINYKFAESGSAGYNVEHGSTDLGINDSGTTEYYDYKGPGGAVLSFERLRHEDVWDVSVGQELDLREIQIYPPTS